MRKTLAIVMSLCMAVSLAACGGNTKETDTGAAGMTAGVGGTVPAGDWGSEYVIGSCISSCVLSSGDIFNKAEIPTFGTGTSPTWMQQGWEYVFRACQNNDFALPLVINKLKEIGVTKVANCGAGRRGCCRSKDFYRTGRGGRDYHYNVGKLCGR